MIQLGCTWNNRAFDDGRKSVREGVENTFYDAGIARTGFGMRRGGNGDVGHVNVVDDIAELGTSGGVMNEQLVSIAKTVLNGSTNHARSNDSNLHIIPSCSPVRRGVKFPILGHLRGL